MRRARGCGEDITRRRGMPECPEAQDPPDRRRPQLISLHHRSTEGEQRPLAIARRARVLEHHSPGVFGAERDLRLRDGPKEIAELCGPRGRQPVARDTLDHRLDDRVGFARECRSDLLDVLRRPVVTSRYPSRRETGRFRAGSGRAVCADALPWPPAGGGRTSPESSPAL